MRRLQKSLREITVVYLDKKPRCVGALHTSGKVLVPASCVEGDGEHHVAFIDVDRRIPKMFPKAKVYRVSNIIAYPEYTRTHSTGYNIAMLELKTKKLHRHIHRPVDLYSTNTNTVNVRMGWFHNSQKGTPRYCNETLYSNWFTKDTPKCAPLSNEFNITYPLGYVDFTTHDGGLHIRSFNAPFSLHTSLAIFYGWIENSQLYNNEARRPFLWSAPADSVENQPSLLHPSVHFLCLRATVIFTLC